MQARQDVPRLMVWVAALLFGACSLWSLSEQDIFWQIRAGYELLSTGHWPRIDTWSYSAAGKPWMNIQWLSTVLFASAHAAAGETGLVLLRGVVVALLMGLAGESVRRACGALRPASVAWVLAATLPLLYAGLLPRLQLRSDLLVLVVFAAMLFVWLREPMSTIEARRRRLITVGLVVLAANLHAGTAPFVVVLALTLLVSEPHPYRSAAPYLAACVAAFFVTPYTYEPLPLMWAHVFYYDHSLMQNPDHQPISLQYLWTVHGLAYLILASIGQVAFGWLLVRRPTTLPAPYRAVSTAVLLALLTLMSCNRVRVMPYHMVLLLPVLTMAMASLRVTVLFAADLVAGALCVMGGINLAPTWGFGVNDTVFPVGSTRFLQQTRPARNVMHTFAYGAYLVWYLRDYPLYVDTRETMYWQLQQEVLGAYFSPEIATAVARKYDVKTVLMPIPQTRYVPGVGFEDLLASYLPSKAWALVYFDKISFVMLARIPEHAAIIAAHEYKHLRPNLPANGYIHRSDRTPASDAEFVSELGRCRAAEPESVFCLVAQASWWRASDPNRDPADSLALLERARGLVTPRSTQYLTLMLELQHAYRASGREAQAAAIDVALGPSTVVTMDSEK